MSGASDYSYFRGREKRFKEKVVDEYRKNNVVELRKNFIMSAIPMAFVLDKRLGLSDFKVLSFLTIKQNNHVVKEKHICTMSILTMSQLIGLSVKTIKKSLTKLKNLGIILTKRNFNQTLDMFVLDARYVYRHIPEESCENLNFFLCLDENNKTGFGQYLEKNHALV